MDHLITELKGYFPKATIHKLDESMIEVQMPKAKESVVIQQQEEEGRYTVSYPRLEVDEVRKIKKEITHTNVNILKSGIFWILKGIQKNGKVTPEF
ncbi:hypothetical protein [uncultured Aquimarina sp.]|uniref:hypothetical protein n=1 Tax=uncultured Aquimarina sp. TaxID=575652 RepID=UPI0026296F60|nr:hypothetical protein [uncultured Aquimarina sp.]